MKKIFFTWAAIAAAVWGGTATVEHVMLTDNPRRIAVILDSSYPMTETWDRARTAAEDLDGARYAVYAAYSDKARIHDFQQNLNFGRMTPYGPQDDDALANRAKQVDSSAADRVYFVTSDTSQNIPAGWNVIEVETR